MTVLIAHIFGAMDRGGAELRTLDVAPRVPHTQHLYITLSGRRGELADEIETAGGRVLPCRLAFGFPFRFWRLLLHERPDVVHSNVATFSGAILLIARLAGVRHRVAHFRSDGDQHGNGRRRQLQRAVMRWLISRCATEVIGNAPGALAFAASDRTCSTGSGVVPDGVVVGPEPDERSRPEIRLLHIARTLPTKRRERAVEIVAAGRAVGLPLRLVLVGSTTPEEGAGLRSCAQELGADSAVELAGQTVDVPSALRDADALLVTSTREGLPGVVMEALAEGCPVVCTDLAGSAFISEFCLGIRLVAVDASDEVWVEALRSLLDADAPSRRAIWQSFTASPFTVEHAARAMGALWRAPV